MNYKKTTKLIVPGNKNIPSLINSIVRATIQIRKDEEDEKCNFNQIHIFHTEESVEELMSTSLDWKTELNNHKILNTSLVHHVTKIEDSSEERFKDFVEQLRDIVKPLEKQEYYIDLSGGIASLKSILAVFAYVLNINNIYILEIEFDDKDRSKNNEQKKMFYSQLIKEIEDDKIRYTKFPPISNFDEFGKLNLTRIVRYRKIFEGVINNLRSLDILDSSIEHIRDSLITGVNSQLSGEVYGGVNDFRNTIFSYSAAAEEISNILIKKYVNDGSLQNKTLGDKLHEIRNLAEVNPNHFINLNVLNNITLLIKSVRNDIVHPKLDSKNDKEILEAKANISYQLVLAFIRFVSNAINTFKDSSGQIYEISEITEPDTSQEYYFGFDGDNTGDFLDESFHNNDESVLINKSKKIRKAVSAINRELKKHESSSIRVLFAEGDNILFKAKLNKSVLQKIQEIYSTETSMNSSIGFGVTLRASAIALKLSKSKLGNTILGIKEIEYLN